MSLLQAKLATGDVGISPETNELDVQYEPAKNNLPVNQKGYDEPETTDEKLLAKRIQIFQVYFSLIIFDLL